MTINFIRENIEENLSRLERYAKLRFHGPMVKELVFNRTRVLKSEGYAEDVAFAKALKEYSVI